MKNVVLFIAHFINDDTLCRYRKLRDELECEKYDVVWVCTAAEYDEVMFPKDVKGIVYRSSDFQGLGYTPIENTIVPGCPHFIPLRFYQDNKGYGGYWFVEYDAVFTGKWNTMMDDCDENLRNYDFLTCHVERFGDDNKEWSWWYRSNNCGYALADCMKGFNPVCRYSRRALALLDEYMKKGYSAHSEVMITTCLYHHGFKIGDLGGTGEFTPHGYRNKYYVQGRGVNNGTMRWRPLYTMEEIEALGTKNKLFHPIK